MTMSFPPSQSIRNEQLDESFEASDSCLIAVNVQPGNGSQEELDVAFLRQLVEEQNLETLEELGGVEGVATALGASLEDGLMRNVATQRRKFGANELRNPPNRSFFHLMRRALFDRSIVIIAACAALSLGFGIRVDGIAGAKEGAGMFVAILIAGVVVFTSEYLNGKVLRELHNAVGCALVEVLRGSWHLSVPMLHIVVGDVVFLKPGDQVPGHGLLLDNSCLRLKQDHGGDTEVNPVHPFLFSGTKVIDGFGWMVVTSVGVSRSKIGQNSIDKTDLERRLETMDLVTDWSGYALAFFALLFTLIGTNANYTFTDDDGDEQPLRGLAKINAVVGVIVAIITTVVDIPDPWKLSLRLTWTYAIKKLMGHRALVLKPSGLEALSYANTICIDVSNKAKVVEFWLPSCTKFMVGRAYELLEEGIALNVSFDSLANKVLLMWATKDLRMDLTKAERNCYTCSTSLKGGIIRTLAKRKPNDCEVQVHWFGDAKFILPICSKFYDHSGFIKDIDENQRSNFNEHIRRVIKSDLKCIAFAHKKILTREPQIESKDDEQREMILLGVIAINNTFHAGIKETVACCRKAGVNVKLITADNLLVAKAIAGECGIIVSHDREKVIEGVDFQNLSPNKRMSEIDSISVMASSTTDDKLLMVKCLKEKDEVVAIVSNATENDSIVTKVADVVISIGVQGTDDEESASIVVLDEVFYSIPLLMAWGRCVCTSVQKFIQFRLSASFSALVANFTGSFSGASVPLTTIQLLWVSVVTDTLGALAFSREKPAEELEPPGRKTDPLITNIMLRNILAQTLYQIALVLILDKLFVSDPQYEEVSNTFLFNSYLLCQVFNEFNSRKFDKKNVFLGIRSNRLFLSIVALTIVLQVLFIEFLQKVIDVERLNWSQWSICAAIAFATLPIGWLVRFIPVPKKEVFSYLMIVKERIARPLKLRSFSRLSTGSPTGSCQHDSTQ